MCHGGAGASMSLYRRSHMTIPTKIRPPTERLQLIQEAAKVEQEEWQHRCIINLFIIPCYSPLINPSPQKAWPLLSCLGKCHPSERVWDTAGERKDKFSVCILISLTSAYLLLWKWGNSGEAERAGPATCRLLWQLMWIWPHYCWQVWEKKLNKTKHEEHRQFIVNTAKNPWHSFYLWNI